MKNCKHVWKTHETTIGSGSNTKGAGSTTWCTKCKVRKPGDKSEREEMWDRWSDRVGEFR